MVQTHSRKKIEIIVETPILARVEALLVKAGAKGYTVLEGAKGFGAQGAWQEDSLTQASGMMIVTVILTSEAADAVLRDLMPLLASWRGVASVSDVQVLRPDRF
jgi:PII-like signaling protein